MAGGCAAPDRSFCRMNATVRIDASFAVITCREFAEAKACVSCLSRMRVRTID